MTIRRMQRHDPGPRRSRSVESSLRQTRILAAIALAAPVGGIASDFARFHCVEHLVGDVVGRDLGHVDTRGPGKPVLDAGSVECVSA